MDNKLIFENWNAFKDSERQRVKQEAFGGLFGKAPNPLGPAPKGLAKKLTGATGRYDRAYEQLEKDLEDIFSQPGKCFFTHTVRPQSLASPTLDVEKNIEQNGIYFTQYRTGKVRPFLAPIRGAKPKQMTAFLRGSQYIAYNPDAPTFIVALPGGSCPYDANDMQEMALKYSEELATPSPITKKGVEPANRRIPPKYIVGIIKNGKLKKA
ncbi:MAG TPA: hypothetical protein DEQ32_13745 [Gammaproteobacteria bacterium]|nr:hypothetical protein [Gammaproteobacteria bacterium]|tara:strand:- start:1064 stop:1693 length:630 start_codon:yes stop_codon:yes gene_type:complete